MTNISLKEVKGKTWIKLRPKTQLKINFRIRKEKKYTLVQNK